MRVLVTTEREKYEYIDTTPKLDSSIIEKYDIIIIKDIDTNYKEILYYLTLIHARGKKLIYVSSHQVQPLSYLISLFGGHRYTDVDLISQDTIDYLIDSAGILGVEVTTPKDVLQVFSKNFKPLLTGTLEERQNFLANENMFHELINNYRILEDTIDEIKSKDSSLKTLLQGVAKNYAEYEASITSLRKQLADTQNILQETRVEGRSNTLFAYPSYRVEHPTKKLMYVIQYSPCIYLTTFLLSYLDYVNVHLNKRARLLIVAPRLQTVTQKYGAISLITESNATTIFNQTQKNVFFTTEPKKKVLDAFMKDGKHDLHIILDMTCSGSFILGDRVVTYGAVSSESDIKRFGLNEMFTFTGMFSVRGTMGLLRLKNYKTISESNQKSIYYRTYKETHYDRIDKQLKLR